MVVTLPDGSIETILGNNSCKRKSKELLGDDLFECLYNSLEEELYEEVEKDVENMYCCDCDTKTNLQDSLDTIQYKADQTIDLIDEGLDCDDIDIIKDLLNKIRDKVELISCNAIYY